MVIGFWNINNNTDLGDILIEFVKEYSIDILLLAEADLNPKQKRKFAVDDIILDFLVKSKSQFSRPYQLIKNNDFRVKLLSSYPSSFFKLQNEFIKGSRWTSFLVDIPGIIRFNLFPVHFQSKVNWTNSSLAMECVNLARDIDLIENNTSCENTILIGDFNMNPFEDGIVAANGLNSHQDLDYLVQNKKGREIDGTYYRFFYNPMWNFFGDQIKPIGTMYYRPSGHISHEWHCYDQVMIRPEMSLHLTEKSVKIVSEISGRSLLTKLNRPSEVYSDHLPIILELFA